MPEINIRNNNRPMTDDNLIALVKNIARAYREIGMITEREYRRAMDAENINAVQEVIADVPEMDGATRLRFCKSFVGNDIENFNGATPDILAYAYIATRNDNSEMFRALAAKIDEQSADFAREGVLNKNDEKSISIIADLYSGFKLALESRIADLDATRDADKIAQMKSNIAQLDATINAWDGVNGLNKLRPEDAEKLNARWNELNGVLGKIGLSAEAKEEVANVKFLDAENNELNQFLDDGGLDPEGRAAALLELARGNIAREQVARVDEDINAEELDLKLNSEFMTQLRLAARDGVISDADYNDILDENANATAGWVARAKSKLGSAADKVRGFFGRVFRKNEDVDRLSNVRMASDVVSVRQRRIELSKRILTGMLSGLVAGALITTIVTAAAATAGISRATAAAMIGVTTSIGIGVVQVVRWHRRQTAAGAPTDLRAFFADARLLSSLGVSVFAIAAMLFGAGGMTATATALGYGTLGAGGVKNGVEAFIDARKSRRADGRRMSILEAAGWGVGNTLAVIGGGMLGRYLANMGIDAYNNAHPKNTTFKNAETRTEAYEKTREVEHTRTVTDYPSDAIPRAEARVQAWYQDNPDLLQQRVEAINQYNLEHGTDINPYRALNVIGLAGEQTPDNMMLHVNNGGAVPSHGLHGAYTGAGWQNTYGYTPEQIDLAAHTFNPDGTINPEGMEIVRQLDLNNLGSGGTVGVVDGARGAHTDGVLPQNDIARGTEVSFNGRVHSVYSPTGELPTQRTETWTETQTETAHRDVPDYTRAQGDGMAAFGNYNPRDRKTTPRSRIGTWWNRVNNDRIVPVDRGHDDELTPIVEPVVPLDEPRETIEPVVPVDEPRETIEPVVPAGNTKDPVNFDDIFTAPIVEDSEQKPQPENPFDFMPVNPIVKEENRHNPNDEIFAAPIIEPEPVVEPESVIADNGILAITRSQAKSWHDLHARLEKTQAKLEKSPRGAKAAKLRAERSKLQYLINNLRNELGHYDDDTIERAAREALLREDLNRKAALVAAGPGANASKWDEIDWRGEIAKIDHKIDKKIEKWGAEIEHNAMANADELTYPTSVPGVQRQKKDARGDVKLPSENEFLPAQPRDEFVEFVPVVEPENLAHKTTRAERRAARREQRQERKEQKRAQYRAGLAALPQKIERFGLFETLKHAFGKQERNDWPGREYFVPESLERLVENNDLTTEPITYIGDAPVRLVNLGKNDFPVTQNRDVPLVVVDIENGDDIIKIPFYLETGLNGDSRRPTGRWYPVSMLNADGESYSDSTFASEELDEIAAALDEKIGDIRNYRDQELTARRELAGGVGFVGGADAVQHVAPEPVMDMVSASINATNGQELFSHNAAANGYSAYTSVDDERLLGRLYDITESAKRRARERAKQNLRGRINEFFGWSNHGDERA